MTVIEQRDKLRAALEALMTNPHINLGDMVYTVRDRELLGWDGPSVVAWGKAVADAQELLVKIPKA